MIMDVLNHRHVFLSHNSGFTSSFAIRSTDPLGFAFLLAVDRVRITIEDDVHRSFIPRRTEVHCA